MREDAVLIVAVLLVVGVFSGCVGSTSSSEAGDPATSASATVDAGSNAASTDEVGSLTGVVTDDEAVPLSGVKIAILTPDLSALTDEAGKYTFLNLKVGEYEVFAERLGYESKAAKVTIESGKETSHNFQLIALAISDAYPETDHYATVLECMVQTFVWVSTCTWPYELVYLTAHKNGVNLTNYGLPPDVMDNKFRDKVTVKFGADENIVSELEWRANTDLAKQMQINNCLDYDQIQDSCTGSFANKAGESPINHMFELPKQHRPKAADKPFTYVSAIWLNWGSVDQVGLVLDQKVDLYNTVFYNGAPPEEFTVLAPKA